MKIRLLTIAAVLPDGHTPASHSRGQNVGVGGKHLWCRIAPNEDKVRRATQRELRTLDRMVCAELLERYPNATLKVSTFRGMK